MTNNLSKELFFLVITNMIELIQNFIEDKIFNELNMLL